MWDLSSLTRDWTCTLCIARSILNHWTNGEGPPSTFEALVVWPVVGHCHGEELGPFCWPMLAANVAVFSVSHQFAEHTSQISLGFRKLQWIRQAADYQTVTMTFKFVFGKCFDASSWSSHWAGHCWLSYTVHFLSHITTNRKMDCCCTE